eukprot:5650661-Amphidinium_carterae.1
MAYAQGLRGRSSLERLLTLPATRSKDHVAVHHVLGLAVPKCCVKDLTSIIGDDPPQSVDAMDQTERLLPLMFPLRGL